MTSFEKTFLNTYRYILIFFHVFNFITINIDISFKSMIFKISMNKNKLNDPIKLMSSKL